MMDMAILLHDGLARTYPTSICHVRFSWYYPIPARAPRL